MKKSILSILFILLMVSIGDASEKKPRTSIDRVQYSIRNNNIDKLGAQHTKLYRRLNSILKVSRKKPRFFDYKRQRSMMNDIYVLSTQYATLYALYERYARYDSIIYASGGKPQNLSDRARYDSLYKAINSSYKAMVGLRDSLVKARDIGRRQRMQRGESSTKVNILRKASAYDAYGTAVGYIEYNETVKSTEYGSWVTRYDQEHYTVTETYQVESGNNHVSTRTRDVVKSHQVPHNEFHVEEVRRDTTYVKIVRCVNDFKSGDVSISDLYPDWSSMTDAQILEWLSTNCNQRVVDRVHREKMDKLIQEKFN